MHLFTQNGFLACIAGHYVILEYWQDGTVITVN